MVAIEMKERLSSQSELERQRKKVFDGTDLDSWRERHRAADAKLMKLEEELDVLLHWAQVLREERAELTKDQHQYPGCSSKKNNLKDIHERLDKYVSLSHKGKALDDMVESLKEECATSRSECNYIMNKIRSLSPRPKRSSLFSRKSLHTEDSLASGGAESGFTDPIAVAERIMSAEHTATGVGAFVGAFGAGIAYTTLFSATRGRLDLISWAFTCFLFVIMSCGAFQMFALPRHGQISRILRMEYLGSADHRLFNYVMFVGLPMVAGFILLALSVALLDADSQSTTPGSQVAVRAAGYLPVAFLGYFVVAMVFVMLVTMAIRVLSRCGFLHWRPMEHIPAEARKDYPSVLFGVKDKLLFLPGGKGYSVYREQRLCRAEKIGDV